MKGLRLLMASVSLIPASSLMSCAEMSQVLSPVQRPALDRTTLR